MKKRFVDPFFPNRPVDDPSRFEGRSEEVDEIVDVLFQTANSNPSHAIITGERGIGKSSLLLQTSLLAKGNNTLPTRFEIDLGMESFNFHVVWVDCTSGQSLENLIECILSELQTSLAKFIKSWSLQIDIAGYLKIAKKVSEERSITNLVDKFVYELSLVYEKLEKEKKTGIVIFIDEIDRIDPRTGIGTFIKLSCEKFSRSDLKKIMFFCAGIKGAVQEMQTEHESILRTLRDIPLDRFSPNDVKDILRTGFMKVDHTWDDEVLDLCVKFSAGFPEPAHLIGSELLTESDDTHLDTNDFIKAKDKVIRDVRKNSLESKLKSAGTGKYQLILEAMARFDEENISNERISSVINYPQNEYSTNMSNLVEKGIIFKVNRGIYSFVDPLLKEYIRSFGIIK